MISPYISTAVFYLPSKNSKQNESAGCLLEMEKRAIIMLQGERAVWLCVSVAVLLHGLPLLFMNRALFMEGPICVCVISGAVTQRAKTFTPLEQDCHFYERTSCVEINARQPIRASGSEGAMNVKGAFNRAAIQPHFPFIPLH